MDTQLTKNKIHHGPIRGFNHIEKHIFSPIFQENNKLLKFSNRNNEKKKMLI